MASLAEATNPRVPSWAFQPWVAWVYLALVTALLFTPLWRANFLLYVVSAVFTYRDRKARAVPAFWWTFGVVCLGPYVYIFYVYRRRRHGAKGEHRRLLNASSNVMAAPPSLPDAARSSGWYPDPQRDHAQRYWDGSAWTEHRAPHAANAPSGYYPAPSGSSAWVYWDGSAWRDDTAQRVSDNRDHQQETVRGGENASQLAAEIEQLAALHRQGHLTSEEFTQSKQALISRASGRGPQSGRTE